MKKTFNLLQITLYIIVTFLMLVLFVYVYKNKDPKYQEFMTGQEKHVDVEDVHIYNDDYSIDTKLPTSIPYQKIFKIDIDLSKYSNYGYLKTIVTKIWYVNFYIYADDEMIYKAEVPPDSIIASGGHKVIEFDIPKRYEDSIITLVYKSNFDKLDINEISAIYLGSKSSILKERIDEEFLSVLLSSIFFMLFILIFVISVVNNVILKNTENTFLHLALMGLLLCLYLLPQMLIFSYMLSEHYLLAYFIEFTSLILMPLPVYLIIKDRLDPRYNIFFVLIITFLLLSVFVQTIFTLTNFIEYRESLLFTQLSIIFSVIAIVILIFITDGKKYPAKRELLFTIVPIVANVSIALGYYMMYGVVIFKEVIGFFGLIFILVEGRTAVNNIVSYRKEKIKNETYKLLAYTDSLTNLSNRAAYNKFIDEEHKDDEPSWLLSVDLDNLKEINDKYGHSKGDKMLEKFAEILVKYLGEFDDSQVFRIGGDEFVIYLKEDKGFDIYDWVASLREESKEIEFDENIKGIYFSAGYCYYDSKENLNLLDCIAFADEKMYEEKNKHKMEKSI